MSIFNKLNSIFFSPTPSEKNSKSSEYNWTNIEDIQSIEIPCYPTNPGVASPVNNIEYILHRKATEFKKEKKEDLAIACLKKANELFPYSNFSWGKKDYMRVVEFLKDFGRFDEARKEEKRILELYSKYFSENKFHQNSTDENAIDTFIETNKKVFYSDGSDLVSTELTPIACTCEICSCYRGRIFSVYGKDTRFPKLPDILRKMYIHKDCMLRFSPIIFFNGDRNNFNPSYDSSISFTFSS